MTDRIALVGVQESYRDVLKEALHEERAVREALETRVEELARDLDDARRAVCAAESERDRARVAAGRTEDLLKRAEAVAAERDRAVMECAEMRTEAAKTTERALSRVKSIDEYENGLQLQILALKERLVSSQASSTRDRTQLTKAISTLTNDLQQRDAAALRLQDTLTQQQQEAQRRLDESVAAALRQVEPYKELNTQLMHQLSRAKEEGSILRGEAHALLQRIEEAESDVDRLQHENTRLKEAQRMLTAGYRPGRPAAAAAVAAPVEVGKVQSSHAMHEGAQEADSQLQQLHMQLLQLSSAAPAARLHGEAEAEGGGLDEEEWRSSPQPRPVSPPSPPGGAAGALQPQQQAISEASHWGGASPVPFDGVCAGPVGEELVAETEAEEAGVGSAELGLGQAVPEQDHAEALDALKSSLSDVRGLLAKRARRRQSG